MSLPSLLAKIAAQCGEDVAIAIGERIGGTNISIPKAMTDRHPLRQVLDSDTAEAVAAVLGAGEHYIPALTRYYSAARQARVQDVAGSLPVAEIARREGITTRRVWQLLQEAAR